MHIYIYTYIFFVQPLVNRNTLVSHEHPLILATFKSIKRTNNLINRLTEKWYDSSSKYFRIYLEYFLELETTFPIAFLSTVVLPVEISLIKQLNLDNLPS